MSVRRFAIPAFASLFALAACDGGGSTDECTEGASQCDGDVVQVCDAGTWVDDEDCAAQDLSCHDEEPAHCMDMSGM